MRYWGSYGHCYPPRHQVSQIPRPICYRSDAVTEQLALLERDFQAGGRPTRGRDEYYLHASQVTRDIVRRIVYQDEENVYHSPSSIDYVSR